MLTPGLRSLVFVGEKLLTSFSSSSGEFLFELNLQRAFNMCIRLATNIIVSSMLILGGSATVTDLSGMNTIAACFLIPVGVAIYVVVGGMRATLLCD